MASLGSWVSGFVGKARDGFSKFLNTAITFIGQLPNKINYWLLLALTKVAQFFINIYNKAKSGISSFINAIINVVKTLGSKMWTGLKSGIDKVSNFANDIKNKAKEAGSGFVNNILSFFKQLPSKLKSAGTDAIKGIWEGMKSAKDWLYDRIKDLADFIPTTVKKLLHIASPSKVMRDKVGVFISQGIAVGITKGISTVKKSLQDLAKSTISTAKSTLKASNFETVGKNIVSSFTQTIDNTVKTSTNSIKTLIKTHNDAYQKTLSKNQQKKYKTFLDNVTKSYQNVLTSFQKNAKNILNTTLDNVVKTYEDKFKKISDAYTSMNNKLADFGDIFTKTNDNLIILNDLEAQTKAITDYEKVLISLKKSISEDLFDYVAGLDVQTGQAYAETLLNMTDEERKKYDKAYVNKLTQAQKLSEDLYKDDIKKLNQEYNKAVDNALKDVSKKVSNLGKQAINGLITGMKGQTKNLGTEVQRLANTLIKQFKKALKIKSPSKRLADEIGKFVPLGLAQGIKENTKGLISEVKAMSEEVVATARGLDVGNIIPDMSNVKALRPNSYADLQGYNGNVYNYTFNQTNTSPKALDRLEIYKQTQQQLNFAKLVMNNG